MKPKVAIVCGYFDWFSGYQETALAHALSKLATVEVIAGDRVSPIFTDDHLQGLGQARRYPPTLRREENGVRVTRFQVREKRSIVWSWKAVSYLRNQTYDLVIQVMPGQGLPIAPTLVNAGKSRVVLYGDNAGMWHMLPRWQRALKWIGFSSTKGISYRLVNARARKIYGYTPETLTRLRHFIGGAEAGVLPLAFNQDAFFPSHKLREQARKRLGFSDDDRVIISAGKFQAYKGLEAIVEAAQALSLDSGTVRVLLVGAGDSEYSRQLQSWVANRSHNSVSVTVLPFQKSADLNALFNCADVGIWPRFPAITIQQAMGTGLKVILPRNHWVGHLIISDSAGLYFDSADEPNGLLSSLQSSLLIGDTQGQRLERARLNHWFSGEGVASQILDDVGVSGITHC